MPDDEDEFNQLDRESREDDELSAYEAPGQDPYPSGDAGPAPLGPSVPASERLTTCDESIGHDARMRGGAETTEVRPRHAVTEGERPDTGEQRTHSAQQGLMAPDRGAEGTVIAGADIPRAGAPPPVTTPTSPVFTLTLTFRIKDGLGLCCEPAVQAFLGQRNSPGALAAAVPPLARVLRLAGQESRENADFSLLGAQVSDLLVAYALTRQAAAQAETQKRAQAAAARQRKSDEEARRVLGSTHAGTVGGGAAGPSHVAGGPIASESSATVRPDPQSGTRTASPDAPAADTMQLSLFG